MADSLPSYAVDSPVWRAWFDGAALPNPGRMGLGAVLLGPEGQRFEISRIAAGHGCNNEAEVRALCALLELAIQHSAQRLEILGDSDIVVRLVPDPSAREALRLAPLFAEARRLMAALGESSLRWVPRHRNAEADRLSRAALGLSAKPANSPSARFRRR